MGEGEHVEINSEQLQLLLDVDRSLTIGGKRVKGERRKVLDQLEALGLARWARDRRHAWVTVSGADLCAAYRAGEIRTTDIGATDE
jgi:hypothetical protein